MESAVLSIKNVDGKLLLLCDGMILPRQTYCEVRQNIDDAFEGIAICYVEFLHNERELPPLPHHPQVKITGRFLDVNGKPVECVLAKSEVEAYKYYLSAKINLKNDKSFSTGAADEL